MTRPADAPDGWWLTLLWVADDEGVVSFRDVAPAGGPPPDPPVARLGPAVAGALSGLILEDDGRLQLRLGPLVPPEDPTRPWRAPRRWAPINSRTRCSRDSVAPSRV
jgi:hypothetical protein